MRNNFCAFKIQFFTAEQQNAKGITLFCHVPSSKMYLGSSNRWRKPLFPPNLRIRKEIAMLLFLKPRKMSLNGSLLHGGSSSHEMGQG